MNKKSKIIAFILLGISLLLLGFALYSTAYTVNSLLNAGRFGRQPFIIYHISYLVFRVMEVVFYILLIMATALRKRTLCKVSYLALAIGNGIVLICYMLFVEHGFSSRELFWLSTSYLSFVAVSLVYVFLFISVNRKRKVFDIFFWCGIGVYELVTIMNIIYYYVVFDVRSITSNMCTLIFVIVYITPFFVNRALAKESNNSETPMPVQHC